MLSYASCSVRIAHCFYNIYHFFFYLFFWTDSFFVFSLTPQSCKIQRLKIFLCGKIIFLSKTSQHRVMQKAMKLQCSRYTMINQDLYQRGYLTSLLKCITKDQAEYVLKEIHEGVCDIHSRARTMVAKVLKASYYWLILQGGYAKYVKKCAKCQEFGPLHHLKPKMLHNMTST